MVLDGHRKDLFMRRVGTVAFSENEKVHMDLTAQIHFDVK